MKTDFSVSFCIFKLLLSLEYGCMKAENIAYDVGHIV